MHQTLLFVLKKRVYSNLPLCVLRKLVGLSFAHAELLSRLLVNSDLRGVRSHGTRAANRYCISFAEGKLNPQPEIKLVHETPTAVVLEGDGTLGYLPMVQATEHAIAKAKEVGMGMGLVR